MAPYSRPTDILLVDADARPGDQLAVRVQRSAPSVSIVSEKAIPKQYWTTPEPMLARSELLKALKAKEDVPGAELHQGHHVRIVVA